MTELPSDHTSLADVLIKAQGEVDRLRHNATFYVRNYPGSQYAAEISYICGCGKVGHIYDGERPPTMARARAAHARHKAQLAGRE